MEGAACALVRIAPAVLKWHVLYAMADGAWRIVYESHRPNSRPHTEPPLTAGALAKAARGPLKTGVIGLYFGSVGAANYGHWLIEELPRLKALAALRRRFPGRPVTVLLTRHSPQMNRVRCEAIALALGDEAGVDIAWLDHKRAYSFEELYYASPVSYHPISKSPQALAWLVETLGPRIVPGSHTRIFVERRPEHGRGIVNVEAVRALLGSRGFKTIDPESMSFAEQAAAFAGARIAVGCSGAAMATAVFCPAGASVVHLAPDGWAESFYWDLAGRTGCRYIACHGPVLDAGSPPHRAPFEAPIDLLTKVLDAL